MLLVPAKPGSAAGFTAFLLPLALPGGVSVPLALLGQKAPQTKLPRPKLSPAADGPELSGWLRPPERRAGDVCGELRMARGDQRALAKGRALGAGVTQESVARGCNYLEIPLI